MYYQHGAHITTYKIQCIFKITAKKCEILKINIEVYLQ